MIVLDIDAGNTFIKWRFKELGLQGRIRHGELEQQKWPGQVDRVLVASVAGEPVNNAIADFVKRRWGVVAEFARTESFKAGVTNSYADPSRMGVDRWLAMLSAWDRSKAGCWVVDCGSAITVEQLDDSGCHVGGYIIPGIQLMSRNLLSNTAEIVVDHSIDRFDASPGVNTSEAVQHGINLLLSALAEKVMRESAGQPVYVTGGDGELFCSLANGALWCPDLVMDGLSLALDKQDVV